MPGMKAWRMTPAIVTTQHPGYVHVVAETARVDERFLSEFIERIARAVPEVPDRSYRLLLEVRASETKIDLIAAFKAWRQVSSKGLTRTQIAYVVHGRPIHSIARLIELLSSARRVQLRFFEDNESALRWLGAADGRLIAT